MSGTVRRCHGHRAHTACRKRVPFSPFLILRHSRRPHRRPTRDEGVLRHTTRHYRSRICMLPRRPGTGRGHGNTGQALVTRRLTGRCPAIAIPCVLLLLLRLMVCPDESGEGGHVLLVFALGHFRDDVNGHRLCLGLRSARAGPVVRLL
jgi:hypothetical protein